MQRCTPNAASPHFPRSAASVRAWPLSSGRSQRAVIDSPTDADATADRLRCVTISQSNAAEKIPDSTIDLLTRVREPVYRCMDEMLACVYIFGLCVIVQRPEVISDDYHGDKTNR